MNLKFKDKIFVEGEEFLLRKIQRHEEVAIYQKADLSGFLRIGLPSRIEQDLKLHRKFLVYGFPVSKILNTGELDEMSFYTEESLGEKLFGIKFVEEYKKNGEISGKTFQQFLDIVEKFFRAQFRSKTIEKDWDEVWDSLKIEELVAEKELSNINEHIRVRAERVKKNLEELPFALMQGDFNPYNMLEGGVVDFETAFHAPVVCDVLALPYYMEHFPFAGEVDVEVTREYKWSQENYEKYFETLEKVFNENGFYNIKKYLEDAYFLRSIWLTVGMDNWPKQQQFRYELFKKLLD